MKFRFSAAPAASFFILSLALSSAPATAQYDPPFVARGPVTNPVQEPNVGTCHRKGTAGMWPDGRSAIAWITATASGRYRTFGAGGALEGQNAIGTTEKVDLAMAAYGGFVTAFERQSSGEVLNLQARIFDPRLPAPFPQPITFAGASGRIPAVAAGAEGDFVVAWVTSVPGPAILAARFDAAGNALGSDITVATFAELPQPVDLTRAPDGGFTVYWRQSNPTNGSLLQLRRYAADGAPLGDAEPVASINPQFPRAAGADDGAAVLVFTESTTAALEGRVVAADGTLGDAFPIFDQPANPATRAIPAFLGDGSIAAAAEIHFGGGAGSVHLFRFGRDGQQLGPRVGVAIPTAPGRQFVDPQLAASGDRLAVFYAVQDGASPCQIYLRYFDATLFADSFESGDTAAWAD